MVGTSSVTTVVTAPPLVKLVSLRYLTGNALDTRYHELPNIQVCVLWSPMFPVLSSSLFISSAFKPSAFSLSVLVLPQISRVKHDGAR